MFRRLLAAACLIIPGGATAQGLAGSEISGIVRLADGRPSENAVVTLTERNTGARRTMRTPATGVYRFENVDVGAYRLDARAIGSIPTSADSINLHLGDRVRVDITLGAQTTILADAVIYAGRLRDAGAGGPAKTVAGRAARNIPIMNRDLVNLLQLSSQSLGSQGLWITGQHARYNGIQIDGAAANDFFGVSVTPGAASGGRLISPEAIEEVRILVAPFDVRMGGFAGGLINAVTRSGSNRRSWSTFASLTRSELIGTDTSGATVPQFSQIQYGLTASGPVIHDRLQYFLVADFQQRASTLTGVAAGDSTVTEATGLRIRNALRDRFDFDPGGTEAPDLEAPTGNVFLKMSWHPRSNLSLDLTPSFSSSRRDTLNRSLIGDGWRLSKSGAELFSSTAGATIRASFVSGHVTSETIVGFSRNIFGNRSNIRVPAFSIQADIPNVYAAGGSTIGAQGTRTYQSVAQLAHNSSWSAGDHTFVIGTQDFLVGIRDYLLNSRWGVWTFSSVDSLERGGASKYEVALPSNRSQPSAKFHGLLASLYFQDQWQPTLGFRITAGIRGDVEVFEHPLQNLSLLANDTLGNIDTRAIASGNWAFAPRLGFAWTVDKRARMMLRGGIGLFTARPPYAWMTQVYAQTGQTQSLLTCTPTQGVPTPTADIDNLPTSCSVRDGTSAAKPPVTYTAGGLRLPQAAKAVLGFDTDLGRRWIGSVDVIAARTRNQVEASDRNLAILSNNTEQREMFGTISATGVATPTRLSRTYGPAYRFGNYSADRSFSASVSVRKDWSADKLVDVEYTWSRTRDVMGLTGFTGQAIFRSNPIDGTLESRAVRRSVRDIPHNFIATAIAPIAGGFTGGLFLRARSGTPWAFTVSGDANADGAQGNDLAYLPLDSSDISLRNPAVYSSLNDLIERLGCARWQRGKIMQRNSCRNASVKRLDGRISKSFTQSNRRRIEVSADVFNIPNLVNHRWGMIRETANREDVPLMSVVGWDNVRNRPLYSVVIPLNGVPVLPAINKAVVDASRWSIQLGARYEF